MVVAIKQLLQILHLTEMLFDMKRYILLLFFIPLLGFAQTIPSDKNAIIHSKFRVATTNEADASDPNKAVITVAYSDGLGRGLQTVGYQQSPTNKDIVSGAVEFDKFGRVIRTALTAPTTDNTGTYQANAFSLANGFYGDSYSYSATTVFDNSPLNRAREQYGAGNAWRTANKKIQNFDESAGTDVRYYYIDGSGNIVLSGTYPSNSLYKKRTIDEQGHTSISITDKRGRLIQKQNQDDNGYATTYYLYDGMGRVLAVIQPEGYELNASIIRYSNDWQKWVFSYDYDYRGRMHIKHVPASGDEYMIYDKWDRLVWSQTPIQREGNKWTFYKYDAFNREIMRGEKSESRSLVALEAETWAWNGDRYESRVGGGLFYSYSNSYPQLFSDTDIRHVNYYDNYNTWLPSGMAFADGGTAFHAQHPEAQGLMVGSRSRSDISGNWLVSVSYYDNKMRVIRSFAHNTQEQIEMLDTEYNHAGEILQTKKIHKNQAGIATTQQSQNELDHVGRVKKVFDGINTTPTEIVKNDYDEIGRLSQKKIFPNNSFVAGGTKEFIERPSQGIITQPNSVDLARRYVLLEPTTDIKAINLNSYLARIDPDAPQGININGLQTMNFSWHLRGGLLGINLDNNGNAIPKASEGDLFSYKLDFETAGFYDGNIGKQYWQGVNDQNQAIGLRSYTMTYDPLKRMTGASFAGINGENYSLSGLSYDKNGNIKTMQRNGKTSGGFGLMDNLTYGYDGNTLTTVADGVSATDNEVDLVPRGGGNYTFYTDGSVKSDANEGISLIIYDTFLRQPKEVQLTDGRKINHYYDGAGTLLKTVYSTDGMPSSEVWEFGGITYKNGQPYQMATPEGRAVYINGSWQYEFFYTDHLGNTRVAFRANGNQLVKTSETAFDPFGVVLRGAGQVNGYQNRFEYQDKEKESTFGLNRINLGARTYNPTTGRMDGIDALADIMRRHSPYQANFNNPLRFIDPDGNEAKDVQDFTYTDGYGTYSARNSSGSVGFSGSYQNSGQDGCPPNCGYGGGDPSTPYKAGDNLKPVSQQNAQLYPSKTDNFTEVEKAAQLGVNIAWTVEGGFSLIKGGINAVKNGFKVAKSWFEVVEVVKVETEAVTALNPTHYLTKSKTQMQTLVDDVRVNGIQESIKYVESNGVKYIVDGHHRYFAAKKLGIQNVPVEQVKLPYSGYKTAADLTLDGTMPGYWKYIK
jgi:RHS repeat-associated protein